MSGPKRKESRIEKEKSLRLDRHRIAVLPLSNISPDPQDEYFADGMTEEMISTVSKIEGLEVISRTSIMQYKKAPKSVKEVCRELDVGIVLEGSVRKAGTKLRVSVQMIDGKRDRHVWAENYDRDLRDVFAIQSDIAKQVAEALKIRLLPANRNQLERSPTSNIEAFTLYLMGRRYYNRENKEGYNLSIDYYERAISKDPSFALAYAGLALSYSGLAFHGMLPSRDAGVKAKMYAGKALMFDDSLAEAHHAMGSIVRNFDWDLNSAEKEFERAVELNPSLADAHTSLATLSMFRRKIERSIEQVNRALELDPLSPRTLGAAGTVYLYVGREEDAIEKFVKALAIDEDNGFARANLGLAYVRAGKFEVGIREIEVAGFNANTGQTDLAYAYAKAGRIEDLRKLLDGLLNRVDKNPELAIAVAGAYANLDDSDNAIKWLETAYAHHVIALISANADFAFDEIREDPRFQDLMKRLGY